jgi:hypothetical protein
VIFDAPRKTLGTVKPVYYGHPFDPKIEAVVDKWSLFKVRVYYKY